MNRGQTLWLTGLSGAGKSTVARAIKDMLEENNVKSVVLDGDDLRAGLNSDLGMSMSDRNENVRRLSEVAVLFCREGYVCIVASISPLRESRQRARKVLEDAGHHFYEVFLDTPLEVCRQRDVKGLYKRVDQGEIKDFTGVDSPYEVPLSADLVLTGVGVDVEVNATKAIRLLLTDG